MLWILWILEARLLKLFNRTGRKKSQKKKLFTVTDSVECGLFGTEASEVPIKLLTTACSGIEFCLASLDRLTNGFTRSWGWDGAVLAKRQTECHDAPRLHSSHRSTLILHGTGLPGFGAIGLKKLAPFSWIRPIHCACCRFG